MPMPSKSVRMTRTGMIVMVASVAGFLLFTVGLPVWRRVAEEKVSMKELLSVSIYLAREGGERVREIRENPSLIKETVKGKTKEGADDMLTAADLNSHRIIHGGLTKTYPRLKVISEEHDDTNEDTLDTVTDVHKSLPDVLSIEKDEFVSPSDIVVWIDPLDATKEYTENLTNYVTTMVCVAIRGRPTIGVVYQPFTRETTWAYVDHGLSPNLLKMTSDIGDNAEVKRVVVSRSHAGDVKDFVSSSSDFLKNSVDVVPAGGAGYKVLQVLQGKADAYVHVTAIKKWDICAGNALVAATKGTMTTLRNAVIDYSTSGDVVNSDGLLVTRLPSKSQHDSFVANFADWNRKRKGKGKL